jgi:hypothetical protein
LASNGLFAFHARVLFRQDLIKILFLQDPFNMTQNNARPNSRNREFQKHSPSLEFHGVEFKVNGLPYVFQFKIWNTSPKQMFIMVKESSDILKRINEGEIFNMKYYHSVSKYPVRLKTKIDYISKGKGGRFRNHFLVGLKILPDQKAAANATARNPDITIINEIK